MNGEGSYMAPEVVVVGKQYTAPYKVDLTLLRKRMKMSEGKVTDANGNIMFKVNSKVMSLRARRVLLDAAGNPIVSFQKKIMSMHSTWKVYRGDSNDSEDLLFTVRKSSLFQFKTQLDVFLASNTSKDNRDFKIKCRGWFEESCTIYAEKSSTVIAEMQKKHSFRRLLLGKDKFAVTVYPHVDNAFIVALVVILEEINEEGNNNGRRRSDFGSASAGAGCGGGAAS
ncbi:protein LURP-one-related 10-like [Apium graveolens]|uniref:protein LURP-one-related 10-like n=1 Tax=Apium graveolens TaxID=4045 RepID=UPI003D7B4F5D